MLIHSQGFVAVVVLDGNEAGVEASFLLGDGTAPLAFRRVGVEFFATEAFEGGDQVCRDALGHHGVKRIEVAVVAVHARLVRAHGNPGHGFHTAADDQVLLARHDPHGGKVDGLLPRAAETVEGDPGGTRFGPARVQHRHARNAGALFAHA